MEKRIEILTLTVAEPFGPLMILREVNGEGMLAIQLAPQDFENIDLVREGKELPAPLIHDAFMQLANFARSGVAYVVISDFKNGAYFADIVVSSTFSETRISGVRPSDAILIALRSRCPIFATEEILEATRVRSHEELADYQLHWLANVQTTTVH